MFGKNVKKLETLIGQDSEFTGNLSAKGTVRVDGSFEGAIRADWVIVGESGRIEGTIESQGTIVAGKVEGNIHGIEIVELKHSACVTGEIRSGKLAISEGAVFVGRSLPIDGHESAAVPDDRVVKLTTTTSASS